MISSLTIVAEQADNYTDYLEVLPVRADDNRLELRILRLEHNLILALLESLDRGLIAEQGGHDFAVLGGSLRPDHHHVIVHDADVPHALAFDPEHEAIAEPAERNLGLDVLNCEQGRAGGNPAD
jgi:hypothetical protein